MEKELFDDLITSLNEAIEYENGDETKGRIKLVEISDDEIAFYSKYKKLSKQNKSKAMNYINDLLAASN
jgi:hypothetical protein